MNSLHGSLDKKIITDILQIKMVAFFQGGCTLSCYTHCPNVPEDIRTE